MSQHLICQPDYCPKQTNLANLPHLSASIRQKDDGEIALVFKLIVTEERNMFRILSSKAVDATKFRRSSCFFKVLYVYDTVFQLGEKFSG